MILGTGHIIFKSGSTEVEVEKVKLLKDEPIEKELSFPSELANETDYYSFGDRHLFQFRYHIYKYKEESLLKFREIWKYKNTKVNFRFYAGVWFKDEDGNEADFYLRMKRDFFDTPDYKDVLILTFESVSPIDLAASALPEKAIITEKGNNFYPQLDGAGNIQLYEKGLENPEE